jgi:hypothetical protein
MKHDSLFWAICDLEDDLILEAEEGNMMKKKHGKKAVRIVLIAAAAAALLAGTVVAARLYTRSADRMEENWNRVAQQPMTTEQKDFIDEKSADVGETAEDQGITISVDAVTCTGNRIDLGVQYQVDSTQYSYQSIECFIGKMERYADNPDYGTRSLTSGDYTGGTTAEDGSYQQQWCIVDSSFGEEDRLNDGNTTLRLEITEIGLHLYQDDGVMKDVEVTGSWNLTIPLPESDTTQPVDAQQNAEFTGDLNFTVEGIQVTADNLKFRLAAPSNDYVIVGTDMLELAKAAEPDAPIYSVEALLKDGTNVPTTGGAMSLNEESGMDEWSIQWVTPIDPKSVVALIFSDGTTQQEIPLES